MNAGMIAACLVALSLLSATLIHSAGWTPAPQAPHTTSADIQQPQPAHLPRPIRILIEGEDLSTAQTLRRELKDWSVRIAIPIIFVEKDMERYDLRILLASDEGSDSGSCRPAFSESLSTCDVWLTLRFVSAVGLTPDGKLQFTETGVGTRKGPEITSLARKLAKRLSVLPHSETTPLK